MSRWEDLAMTFDDFAEQEYPDTSLVGEGILNEGGRLLVVGDSGIGKSYIILQMLLQAAVGEPIFGVWKVHKPLKSMYLQVEVAEAMLNKRARRWKASAQGTKNVIMITPESFDIQEQAGRLKHYADEEALDVIALDPLYRIYNGDENSTANVKEAEADIDRAKGPQRAVIITHHVNKPASLGGTPSLSWIRGATAWHNWVDTVFLATGKTQTGFKLYVLKTRNSEEALPKPLELSWQKPGVFFVAKELDDDDGRGDLYREILGAGEITKAALVSAIVAKGVPRSTAYKQIQRAMVEGLIVSDGDLVGLGI